MMRLHYRSLVVTLRPLGLPFCAASAWALSAACFLGACGAPAPPPSPERTRCFVQCAAAKDGCMLDAMNAARVQDCDLRAQQCSATCYER